MNRLKKELFNVPKHSNNVASIRKYDDSKGINRTKKYTHILGDGYTNSRMRLYTAIYMYCSN